MATQRAGKPSSNSASAVAPEPILKLATGFMAAKHLFIANEVRLFEKLSDGPMTLDELAKVAGVPRRTMRIVADAMAALGLVEKTKDRYQNSPLAAAYLSRQPVVDLRPFLRFWNQLSYPRWAKLEEAVREGKGGFGTLKFSREEQEIFSEGVEAFTAGTAEALAVEYDFGRHRRVLDLGGGTGSFLKALLAKHKGLECTLYEVPAVVAVARRRLAGTPFAEKIRTVEGDFLRDSVPEGYDAFLIANVVHVFPPERNLEFLRRIRERAPRGARLLIVDFWTNATHTEPVFAALMAGEFLVMTGEGDVYSVDEARDLFRQTGWQFVEHKSLAGPQSLVVAETTG